MGILRPSPVFHFHVMQMIGFTYLAHLFLSRDFTVLGYLPEEMFHYRRDFVFDGWPIPMFFITGTQFVYSVFPHPSQELLAILQLGVGLSAVCGMIGAFPRLAAWIVLVLGMHLASLHLSANLTLDANLTMPLFLMLILALSPNRNFYRLGRKSNRPQVHVDYHWPIFLFAVFVSFYYCSAGINKFAYVGWDFPLQVHLDRYSTAESEDLVFVMSRYAHPWVLKVFSNAYISAVLAAVIVAIELLFATITFLPSLRPFLIASMALFHIVTYYLLGFGFAGYAVLILLCLDWNVFARKLTVSFVPGNPRLGKLTEWIIKHSTCITLGSWDDGFRKEILTAVDSNGEVYSGPDAIERVCHSVRVAYPLAIAFKIPLIGGCAKMRIWKHLIRTS